MISIKKSLFMQNLNFLGIAVEVYDKFSRVYITVHPLENTEEIYINFSTINNALHFYHIVIKYYHCMAIK